MKPILKMYNKHTTYTEVDETNGINMYVFKTALCCVTIITDLPEATGVPVGVN